MKFFRHIYVLLIRTRKRQYVPSWPTLQNREQNRVAALPYGQQAVLISVHRHEAAAAAGFWP